MLRKNGAFLLITECPLKKLLSVFLHTSAYWFEFLWINKQTWEHKRCSTWVRLQLIHLNILSLMLAPRDILRTRAVQEWHKFWNTTGLFTINILFPLMKIHFLHSCGIPTWATNASCRILPLQIGLLYLLLCLWAETMILFTVFSTVAIGSEPWAVLMSWLFIIDKEICF